MSWSSSRRGVIGGLALVLLLGEAAAVEPEWPATELAGHAQAWFAQLRGSEEDARTFFATHYAPSALQQSPVEARLARRRDFLARTGGLTPLAVLSSSETVLEVRAREGRGEEPVVRFEAEPAPPYRIQGVQLTLGGPGGGPPPASGPPLTEAEAVREMRTLLERESAAGTFSGAVLLARNGSPLLREVWGVADRTTGRLLTPSTRFNLASIGKIPTKIAIAQLAQAGRLTLDDPLAKYLPDFPRASDITIGMLVEHRSGVGDIFNERFETMDRSQLRHNRDYLALIRDQPLWFEPGTGQRYSNGGYVLLGEVITKASGEDYYDYLAKHVFAPAGMKATAALIEGDGTPDVARGYTREGAPAGQERDNVATRPWRGSAAGGSYSTVDDVAALDRALLGAQLCNPAWSAWVFGGPAPGPGESGDASGLQSPGFAFGGGAPGISTEWLHEGEFTLIVLTNRDPETSRPVVRALGDLVRRIAP